MNLAITNDLAHRTHSVVSYEIDPTTHDTTYHLTKDVAGAPHQASVHVSAVQHATENTDAIVNDVTRRAAQLFADARARANTSAKPASFKPLPITSEEVTT